jgi:hypothetical protein
VPSKEDARRLDRALGTGNVLSSFLPQQAPRPRFQNPHGPALVLSAGGWSAFVSAVKDNKFPA